MAAAVSSAVSAYFMSAAVVTSINQVLGPGAGTYTGKIVGCSQKAMSSLMKTKAMSGRILGKDSQRFFEAISFGVCQSLMTTALAQGVVIGGGPGTGRGRITGLVPSALQKLILLNLAGKKLWGSKTDKFLSAVAFGICNHVMTSATVLTSCIGTAAVPTVMIPAAPGPGKIV
jgi:hypothetical protein